MNKKLLSVYFINIIGDHSMDQNTLDGLKKEYIKSIPKKIKYLEDLIDMMKEKKDQETLKNFRFEVHKLAGNAGTYGFSKVSQLCKAQEQLLIPYIESFSSSMMSQSFFLNLDQFIEKIKKGFLCDS